MKIIRNIFGVSGHTLMSKIIYVLMIIYLILLTLVLLVFTDYSDFIMAIISVIFLPLIHYVLLKSLYKRFFKKK